MSKKKLIITITSLCLVVVAAVAAVVGVVAASTQTVNSVVSVTYRANNVKATMGVTSKLEFDDAFGTTRTSQNEVSFLATEGSSAKTITISPEIQLGNSGSSNAAGAGWSFERYIIYRYSFHNDYAGATTVGDVTTPAAGRAMTVTLTYAVASTTQSNVRVAFASQAGGVNTVPTEATAKPAGDGEISAWNTTNVEGTEYVEWTDFTTPSKTITVAQGETGYFYVLVAIQDPLRDASFSCQASAFTFVLTSVATSGDSGSNPGPLN